MPSLAKALRRCHSTVRDADEELRADLRIREVVAGEPSDLLLLWSELVPRLGAPPADPLAGCDELDAGAFGKAFHAVIGEHPVRDLQLLVPVASTSTGILSTGLAGRGFP
jgi:hypothetical protein